ncbi:hypothetical protein HHK36_020690 [Tetracentron sinense]|uniref:Protein kinase domain-containing protein n=1 Tax=Tetracentron sinense TaxID=13715 RepID=A0A834YUF9_TETSI|nr:hypothetical protein HHK36_020690 [Tetracentron sinense]
MAVKSHIEYLPMLMSDGLRCSSSNLQRLQSIHSSKTSFCSIRVFSNQWVFLPPLNASESCWDSYQTLVNEFIPNFNIRSACDFETSWISEGCMNITSSKRLKVVIREKRRNKKKLVQVESSLVSGLEYISRSTTLIRFTFDEIKQATGNFSWENIIGMGGYGNVYKGILPNGSEVALKRFKNCSVVGDESFTHEVEVIASVRHVNLVALRGYCTATTHFEGHQRIIVCDLMRNGSLCDHLFGSVKEKLRAQGMTHLSTRVAGTLGYVTLEYALYGQLAERSDVYSFGVVLLELLSGKKALITANENQTSLVSDWAWSVVRKGRALDVIEEGMPELGAPEVMEKYVLVGVLSSHPQLYARPTMDQIVKILETDLPVPLIPKHPIPLVVDLVDTERLVSSIG